MKLEKFIRSVPDFPKKGILFYDITTLLKDAKGLKAALNKMYKAVKDQKIDKVVSLESRGFIFGPHLAYKLGAGFVPIRKPGKLPAETITEEYALEYGTDQIQVHKDAISAGDKILIVDDLLATGGTARAAVNLIEKLGGQISSLLFLIELSPLKGKAKFTKEKIISLIKY